MRSRLSNTLASSEWSLAADDGLGRCSNYVLDNGPIPLCTAGTLRTSAHLLADGALHRRSFQFLMAEPKPYGSLNSEAELLDRFRPPCRSVR